MQIFNKPFGFYLKPKFPWKVFKCLFKSLSSDEAFGDFLDTCSTFFAFSKKRLVNKSFEFIEKEYEKNNQLLT